MTKKMIQYGERVIRNKTTGLVNNHSKLRSRRLRMLVEMTITKGTFQKGKKRKGGINRDSLHTKVS